MPMLTAEQKAQWLVDLRSGKFKQGKGFLCRFDPKTEEDNFCCLGVLANRLPYCQRVTTTINGGVIYHYEIGNGDYCGMLPRDVINLSTQRELAAMNDRGILSFSELADWIETNVPVAE